MTTIYLKFASEADARTVLAAYVSAEGEWIDVSHNHALDPVGVIYAPTGQTVTDADGMTRQEYAPLPGWHVNFIGELPAEIMAYAVTPTTPARVFA